jgi:PAS domain S-box-containing protein
MTIFAAIPLLCLVTCIFVSVYVFISDPKKLANRIFLVLGFVIMGHVLVEFGYRQSHDLAEALQWKRVDFFWAPMLGLLLHLVLALTERTRALKTVWVYLVVYAPALFFLSIDVSTSWISGAPKLHNWGWSYSIGSSFPLVVCNLLWIISVYVTALVFTIAAYRTAENIHLRNQYRTFAFGLALVIAGDVADLAFSQFDIDSPPLLAPSLTGLYILFAWGVLRYRMFQLSPRTAAETIVTTMTDALFLVDDGGRIMSGNPAAAKMLGYKRSEIAGMQVADVFAVREAIPNWFSVPANGDEAPTEEAGSVRELVYLETSFAMKGGGVVPVSIACSALRDNADRGRGSLIIARDMTERRRADEELTRYRDHLEDLVRTRTAELTASVVRLEQEKDERRRAEAASRELEAQLMHAQKMEAVGRLAGSVAHDFNNLLFVITGYTESLLSTLGRDDSMRLDVEQMHTAARRAGSLVKQLLAFSRKQAAKPRVVNLNAEIAEIERMLERLIGEEIRFSFDPSAEHLRVRFDVGQLQQVITNLVVNAKDAMPDGGALTITTSAVELGEAECATNPEAKAGRHAMIRVSDTGHGMNRELLSRIFEPYFTTKGRGKGTGLGLSTVYGIVKQASGFITVRSEPGKGTVFEIALPQTSDPLENELPEAAWKENRGQEGILLVEDDEIVRRLVKRLLLRQGYRVEEAQSAEEAVHVFERSRDAIDLLFTDVVMPGMNGKQLSEQLLAHRPNLRVLFMSAHAEDLVARYGMAGCTERLLQKPFTANELTSKVREALEA